MVSNSRLQSLSLWALVAGFVPLGYWHVAGMLQKEHYQFLYLWPVAIWLLMRGRQQSRAHETESVTPAGSIVAALLVLAGFAGLLFASWFWSPWVACVSCLVALPGVVIALRGWSGFLSVLPGWLFSFVLLPPPFGLDEDIIVRLRGVTTRGASGFLDQLGVLHDSYANILELPGKSLFIADACSGIHSLYVLMAAALFLITFFGRGVLHSITLIAGTLVLVLGENVLRIVAVALLWQRGYDYSIGTPHEVLGGILFVFSLLILLSLDQLLLFVLPDRLPSVLGWLPRLVRGDQGKAGSRKGTTSGVAFAASICTATGVFVVFAFPALAVLQLVRLPPSVPVPVVSNFEDFSVTGLTEEFFDEEVLGFERTSYENVQRVPGDPLGRDSTQWVFQRGDISVLVSVDWPYGYVHDLCECYGAIGWEVVDRSVLDVETALTAGLADAKSPAAVGMLKRDAYGYGFLMFNLLDGKGETTAVIKALIEGDAEQRGMDRFQSFGEAETRARDNMYPFVQFQILARMPTRPTEKDRLDMQRLFHFVRNRLAEHVSQQNPWGAE